MWRDARPRLMKLSASGVVYQAAKGSRLYLSRMAYKSLRTRRRQWIELPEAPAFLVGDVVASRSAASCAASRATVIGNDPPPLPT